jgi:Ca-activated chloride channel family protein
MVEGGAMKFVYPFWLWGLVLLPVLFLLLIFDERLRRLRFTRFAAEATWKILAPELDFKARIRKGGVWLLATSFILIALARPQWGTREETSKLSGLDVMMVLDISRSMDVEDIIPNRLKKAKHEIRSMVERLKGDRVGLVTFAASAQVSCPLTTDLSYLLDTVSMMDPSFALSQGTDVGLGLETAMKSIERGAQENGGSEQEQEAAKGSQAIILLTDGEDQEDGALDEAKKIRESGTKLYIIGVGSQKGGPIPVRDENGNLVGYKKDHKGQSILSQYKPDELLKLATMAGGRFWSATDNENEVDEIMQDLGGMNRSEFSERKFVVFQERFQYPLSIAVLLLLLEMAIPGRKKSPLGFGGIASVLLLFVPLFGSSQAQAAPLRAYLENEKGIQSLKDGKIEDAKQEFGTAQAVSPDNPRLQFNEGVVQLQEGDADSAIRSFEESTKKSVGTDPDFAAKSFFNLGVAQTKKGDFKSAVKSYLSAIDQSQLSKDPKLEAEARKNLELLSQEQQKQKQQKQQQDQQKKDQQQQQKPNDQKDQQQKQDQQKQDQQKQQQDQKKDGQKDQAKQEQNKQDQSDPGNKQQPQKYDDPHQQNFKSDKLSKEDADRVMEELKHREKELQSKLKKKYANSQTSYNDW